MTLTPQQALEVASRAVDAAVSAGARQAEALVVSSEVALTRFADNRIHQNMATSDTRISVRAVDGQHVGVASTNRTGADPLRECAASALDAARRIPADPHFPGLPEPQAVDTPDRSSPATRAFGAPERAAAVAAIVDQAVEYGARAAGGVAVSDQTLAVVNSLGVRAAMPLSSYRATVLAMGSDGGSGWAAETGRDAGALSPEALGDRAVTLARRSADPTDLAPGTYAVLLAPEAVGEMITYLGWFGLGAKAVEEGRSFMSGHLGERIMSAGFSLIDDATADHSCGPTFDFEGMPKRRVALVDAGVATGPVTDSYWAARTGRPNTGHALPAPNSFGPLPLDLAVAPGDSSPEDMIGSVSRGVYVTRFHYVNVEDPVRAVMTGMTRDGTFLIEDGHLTRPLKNLRFTQSAVDAFSGVLAVSAERELVGEQAGTLAPYLLLERFAFTGQTS